MHFSDFPTSVDSASASTWRFVQRLLLSFEVKIKVKSWQIVIAVYSIFSILVAYRKCTMCYRHRCCRRRRRRVSALSSSFLHFDAGLSFFVSHVFMISVPLLCPWLRGHSDGMVSCAQSVLHALCKLSPSDCRWPCKHDFNSDYHFRKCIHRVSCQLFYCVFFISFFFCLRAATSMPIDSPLIFSALFSWNAFAWSRAENIN